jgi:emfourin
LRVEFKVTGGFAAFPGLAAPRVLDSEAMSPEDAATLGRLLKESRFFDLPSVGASTRLPDARTYTIRASDDDGRAHQVTVSDPVQDGSLAELVAFLRSRTAA